MRGTRMRRAAGVAVVLFGLFMLVGGLWVPIQVILREPGIVPAPESWVALWIVLCGLVLTLWPAARRGSGRSEP